MTILNIAVYLHGENQVDHVLINNKNTRIQHRETDIDELGESEIVDLM